MNDVIKFIDDNREWLFSGAGLCILTIIWKMFKKEEGKDKVVLKQDNSFFSHGEQIGIQNNYYKEDGDEK